jgi:hypothetical protein
VCFRNQSLEIRERRAYHDFGGGAIGIRVMLRLTNGYCTLIRRLHRTPTTQHARRRMLFKRVATIGACVPCGNSPWATMTPPLPEGQRAGFRNSLNTSALFLCWTQQTAQRPGSLREARQRGLAVARPKHLHRLQEHDGDSHGDSIGDSDPPHGDGAGAVSRRSRCGQVDPPYRLSFDRAAAHAQHVRNQFLVPWTGSGTLSERSQGIRWFSFTASRIAPSPRM